ncbi:hypothetical protein ACFE04_014531 [Oxalis oulophora]
MVSTQISLSSSHSLLSLQHSISFNNNNNNNNGQNYKCCCYYYTHKTHKPKRHPKKFQQKDAFPSSLPLHTKNPSAIYKDVQRFANENKLKEALAIMDYLDQQGIPVNATTLSSLIEACIRTKSLDHGKQVHTHVNINSLQNNDFLRKKLVQMYTCCHSFDDANKLFDESNVTNVYPWNAMLRGSVIAGNRRYNDVLLTYTRMRELGVGLDVYTFSNVFKSFAGAKAFKQGLKTHALLIKNGFVDSSMLKTSLIDLYFKCGKINLARKLFEEIADRDVVLWGTMIAGFSHNRLYREALDCVRTMVGEGIYPNAVILTSILPVIGDVWERRLGQEIHAYILKKNRYLQDVFILSGLVNMYCKCGDMSSGRGVFYSTKERSTISWTSLISGYISNGRLDQALRSIVWMQQEGFRPDVVTVATILPVCAELRALKHGKEIHAYALKNWFLPNVSVTTSLMIMYSKCGSLEYSISLFNIMEHKSVISWTAMIDSYVKNRKFLKAVDVFRSMQLSKHRPDSVSMGRMLSICSELKALKLGKELHCQILKKDFEPIPFVSAGLVKMYGSCEEIKCAMLAFEAVPVKGSTTWTSIIEAYGLNHLFREAVDLFYRMVSGGFTPTHLTFDVVLSICDDARFADDALRVFNLMVHRYKIKPSKEHSSIMRRLKTFDNESIPVIPDV